MPLTAGSLVTHHHTLLASDMVTIGKVPPGSEGLEYEHQSVDTPAGGPETTNGEFHQKGTGTGARQRRPGAHWKVCHHGFFCPERKDYFTGPRESVLLCHGI